ncbi:MAG: hypothetical protein OHK0038_17570 [Flammeovirgaceae bacterium]
MNLLEIDKTHIEDYYEGIVFQVFRIWTVEAKKTFPQYDYEVLEEQELIDDLDLAMKKSLKILFETNYEENKHIVGWRTNFFVSALAQHLNLIWFKRFILAYNDSFKRLVWFKSMLLYMDGDELSQISVNRLSKNLLDSPFPFEIKEPVDLEEASPLHLLADLSFKENWLDQKNWLEDFLEKEFNEFFSKNMLSFIVGIRIHHICCPNYDATPLQRFIDVNYEKYLQSKER